MSSHQNIYEGRFEQLINAGYSYADATLAQIDNYLDNKPVRKGKLRIKTSDRDTAFWSSVFLTELTSDICESEPFILALTRYFSQKTLARPELISQVAELAPNSVKRAICYSRLVISGDSLRWTELETLSAASPDKFGDFYELCRRFQRGYEERVALVNQYRAPLARLTPLELLSYSSLYAFEHLIPLNDENLEMLSNDDMQTILSALEETVRWKIETCEPSTLNVTEKGIGKSLKLHMSPFLFPSAEHTGSHEEFYILFSGLIEAQIEFDSFMEQSVDSFCYDESTEFRLDAGEMKIVVVDANKRTQWLKNGEKIVRVSQYWHYRALDDFMASGMGTEVIGSPENHERNQFALIKALRTELQLTEVYGLSESIKTDGGLSVGIYETLLAQELMTAFYIASFIEPFQAYLHETQHWCKALCILALQGFEEGMQNRFPITFSDRKEKIQNIRGWTVNETFPKGNEKAAEAILDFWTSDLKSLSEKLRQNGTNKSPKLSERPVLKMGHYIFQLPWLMALQNNSTAAINNLRRIGAHRAEARDETQRIEAQLAERFRECGFQVALNYQPVKTNEYDPGEVDLICTRDHKLLVIEVKSSFLRSSLKEAWLHKTQTLRKAGNQLTRKVKAVEAALANDSNLIETLQLEQGCSDLEVKGWIVDTSIEHDHEYFSTFLKVSLEEVLIALRDDAELLNDPEDLFSSNAEYIADRCEAVSLYPDGFTANRFIEVIEQQVIWDRSD